MKTLWYRCWPYLVAAAVVAGLPTLFVYVTEVALAVLAVVLVAAAVGLVGWLISDVRDEYRKGDS